MIFTTRKSVWSVGINVDFASAEISCSRYDFHDSWCFHDREISIFCRYEC